MGGGISPGLLQGSLHATVSCKDPCEVAGSYQIWASSVLLILYRTGITNMGSSEQPTLFIIPDHQRKINSAKQKVKSTRHAVSQSQPTHAFLHVRLSSHFAAVHLTIHPFHVQEHQGQIFFSSFYDYFLCCTHSESVITPSLIAEYVQTIYDTYYQPGQWDFSPKISYVPKEHEDYIPL